MGILLFTGGYEDEISFGPLTLDTAALGLFIGLVGIGGVVLFRAVGLGLLRRDAGARSQAVIAVGVAVVAGLLGWTVIGGSPLLFLIPLVLLPVVAGLLYGPGGKEDFPGIGPEGNKLVDEVLASVGLDPAVARAKRPHEFSGGQCQRISIARALVLDPKLIICDEPVSALDVSVQAQILNLLEDMKERYGLTLVFIAHDLAVVKNVSDRVAVMYLGKLCEVAPPDLLYERAAHPYTDALLKSIPVPDPEIRPGGMAEKLQGDLPSPSLHPAGAASARRCPRPRTSAPRRNPRSAPWATASSWPVTSPWSTSRTEQGPPSGAVGSGDRRARMARWHNPLPSRSTTTATTR